MYNPEQWKQKGYYPTDITQQDGMSHRFSTDSSCGKPHLVSTVNERPSIVETTLSKRQSKRLFQKQLQ
jgi:hypothetical protein